MAAYFLWGRTEATFLRITLLMGGAALGRRIFPFAGGGTVDAESQAAFWIEATQRAVLFAGEVVRTRDCACRIFARWGLAGAAMIDGHASSRRTACIAVDLAVAAADGIKVFWADLRLRCADPHVVRNVAGAR